MPQWYHKRSAQRVLGWKKEKGQDLSINRILPELEKLQGNVLEIGAGAGNLLQYLPKGIQYFCIELNPYLHEAIQSEAEKNGFKKITVVGGLAEKMPFAAEFFDAVVCVRSLCSMDTAKVLEEVKRVLKPGGVFVFVEHVAAPKGTWSRLRQKLIRYPHKLLRGGCDPGKDTADFIERAGFSTLHMEKFQLEDKAYRSRIAGVATK